MPIAFKHTFLGGRVSAKLRFAIMLSVSGLFWFNDISTIVGYLMPVVATITIMQRAPSHKDGLMCKHEEMIL